VAAGVPDLVLLCHRHRELCIRSSWRPCQDDKSSIHKLSKFFGVVEVTSAKLGALGALDSLVKRIHKCDAVWNTLCFKATFKLLAM
jgi:hypothetical protein